MTDEITTVRWLMDNRCPWCIHEGRCKGYAVRETYEGWRCYGYRSKYDEVPWKGVGA